MCAICVPKMPLWAWITLILLNHSKGIKDVQIASTVRGKLSICSSNQSFNSKILKIRKAFVKTERTLLTIVILKAASFTGFLELPSVCLLLFLIIPCLLFILSISHQPPVIYHLLVAINEYNNYAAFKQMGSNASIGAQQVLRSSEM